MPAPPPSPPHPTHTHRCGGSPPRPGSASRAGTSPAGASPELTGRAAAAVAAAEAALDAEVVGEQLCYREYEEHIEALLDRYSHADRETSPFEAEGALDPELPHLWRVAGFSVSRDRGVDIVSRRG